LQTGRIVGDAGQNTTPTHSSQLPRTLPASANQRPASAPKLRACRAAGAVAEWRAKLPYFARVASQGESRGHLGAERVSACRAPGTVPAESLPIPLQEAGREPHAPISSA